MLLFQLTFHQRADHAGAGFPPSDAVPDHGVAGKLADQFIFGPGRQRLDALDRRVREGGDEG